MRTGRLSIRHTLMLAIGALALLIVVLIARETWKSWQRLADMRALEATSRASDDLFTAAEMLAAERGIAFSILHAPDEETAARLRPGLRLSAGRSDEALRAALAAAASRGRGDLAAPIARAEARAAVVRALRAEIDRAALAPRHGRDPALAERWFHEITALVQDTEDVWMGLEQRFAGVDPVQSLHMRFKHVLRVVAEYIGRERALVGRLIVESAAPTPEEQSQLLRWHGKVELGWYLGKTLVDQSGLGPSIAAALEDARSHHATLYDMVRGVLYRPGARPQAPYPIGVEFWLEIADQAAEALYALREAALEETRRHVADLAAQARRDIVADGVVLLCALVLCGYTFRVIARRVLGPIEEMVEALVRASEGKAGRATPASRVHADEIEKLAQVLHAFQRGAEETKRTADMLERHAAALERSNRELDEFAYIASHDLKEPLRGMHNHSRFLLEDNQGKLDADSVKRLGRVIYLSERMERLVNDLLYFSRLGRQELAVQRTDLNAVIRDIERTLEATLGEHHARITVPKALPAVTCDAPRITEVFRNLIANAIKYNDKPEKVVEVGFQAARARGNGDPARDVFYVKDNGVGIPPEFHEEVFRIFKRLQRSQHGKEEGTGVGLTFVKKIVERHGGRIWVESEPGHGAVFCFTLRGEHDDVHSGAAA